MTAITLPVKASPNFDASADVDGQKLTLGMVGCADAEVQKVVDSIVKTVHDHALRIKAEEVIVDLRKLEFMNSSCLKAFVAWLASLEEVAADAKYRICFLSDPEKHWQKRSLNALGCFATDLVRIVS